MKPNVLIIHADQLRKDCLSPYKNKQVATPNIKALAEDGVIHEKHFTVFPICTPSRYSLLSGQYVHQHLGWGNHCTIPAGLATFPKVLKKNGWHTCAVGKMHFTPTYLDVGFDDMVLAEQDGDGRFEDDYHRAMMECGVSDNFDLLDQRYEYRKDASKDYFDSFGVRASSLPEEFHSTSWIGARALEKLNGWDKDGGNLLMVGYIKPHHPFDPLPQYVDMYKSEDIMLLDGYCDSVLAVDSSLRDGYFDNASLTPERLKAMTAHYYAAITQIDDSVGEQIALLKKKGLYDNTMIIFTSDHGDYMGYHHLALKGNHMYEPLMNIPLIIKYPNNANAGTEVSSLSSNIDIASEILKACEINDNNTCFGNSLSGRKYVFAEQLITHNNEIKNCYMLRTERYKLLLDGGLGSALFFDLESDPCEFVNLANEPQYAAAVAEHMQYLLSCLAFDAPSREHLDENASVNCEKNKPNEETKKQMAEFMRQSFSDPWYIK